MSLCLESFILPCFWPLEFTILARLRLMCNFCCACSHVNRVGIYSVDFGSCGLSRVFQAMKPASSSPYACFQLRDCVLRYDGDVPILSWKPAIISPRSPNALNNPPHPSQQLRNSERLPYNIVHTGLHSSLNLLLSHVCGNANDRHPSMQ